MWDALDALDALIVFKWRVITRSRYRSARYKAHTLQAGWQLVGPLSDAANPTPAVVAEWLVNLTKTDSSYKPVADIWELTGPQCTRTPQYHVHRVCNAHQILRNSELLILYFVGFEHTITPISRPAAQ